MNITYATIVLLLSSIVLLPSCAYRKKRTYSAKKTPLTGPYAPSCDVARDFIDEYEFRNVESKITDVPIPLGAKPVTFNENELEHGWLAVSRVYSVNMSVQRLNHFFTIGMERVGWGDHQAFSIQDETVLAFQRPDRICIITIHPMSISKVHNNELCWHTVSILYAVKKINENEKSELV